MALKFKVQGLGKIENAEINISPLTVITGPNGTGKSFFTKLAYSIFRVIEESSKYERIHHYISSDLQSISNLKERIDFENEHLSFLLKVEEKYKEVKNLIDSSPNGKIDDPVTLNKIKIVIDSLSQYFDKKVDNPFLTQIIHIDSINSYLKDKGMYSSSELDLFHSLLKTIGCGYGCITIFTLDNIMPYNHIVNSCLIDEIKENFQVPMVEDLQALNSDNIKISLENHFDLKISSEKPSISITPKNLGFFKMKPSSVFFESPAYWRVREALLDAKRRSSNDFLTGVPKYFFDLDSSLGKKSKVESELLHVYESIKAELMGEFIFESGNISFKDASSNKNISKNLVSFGMTNLGMLNALIRNNVIKKGSYVFIDEPETNLHPDWQVLMIQSLVALSKAGVNVIITTHSTEILKYIEVSFSKVKEEESVEKVKELLSVNYLDTDGTSFEFDSECPIEQTKEALATLSSPFFNLYMEGK